MDRKQNQRAMLEGLKKFKIIDIVLVDDDMELLKHRCQNVYDSVNFMIAVVSSTSEKIKELESKTNFWKDKFSIIVMDEDEFFTKKNLQSILLKLKPFELDFDDLICISKNDEIPDYENFDEVFEQIVYGPVVLRNTNFVYHTTLYNKNRHMGTICFNYSYMIKNYVDLITTNESKNSIITSFFNTVDNGYYFQNFGKKTIDEESSLSFYEGDFQFKKDFLVEFIPENICSHKILVIFNMSQSWVDSEKFGEYSKVLNFNFTKDYKLKAIDEMKNLITFNIFLPPHQLYETNSEQNFNLHFGLREIKRILTSMHLLDCQIIDFIIFPIGEDYTKSFTWKVFNNSSLLDEFYEELKKFI